MVLGYLFGSEDLQTEKETVEQKRSKLFKAVRCNDKTTVVNHFNKYPKESPDSYRDDYGNTLLHIAVHYKRIELFKHLLDLKASMHTKNDGDATPTDFLCRKENRRVFDEYLKYLNLDKIRRIEELENHKMSADKDLAEYKLRISVITNQIREIEKELEKLRTEFDRLNTENDRLTKEKESLNQQNRTLRERELASSNDTKLLKEENSKLQHRVLTLEDINTRLSTSVKNYMNENHNLREEKTKLNENGKRLREEKEEFDRENKKLRTANDELKEKVRNLVNNAKKQ